jgi:hypothetical protein
MADNWPEQFDTIPFSVLKYGDYILKLFKKYKKDCVIYMLTTNEPLTNIKIFELTHPFSRIEKDDISKHDNYSYIGGINADNIVMDSIFKMIMTSNEDIKSGHLDPDGYRSHLIKILNELWD